MEPSNLKQINDFNLNGRRYIVCEIIDRYIGDTHTHYAVMFDANGRHTLYVDRRDITPQNIEEKFRSVGLIEPDTDKMSADTFREAINMLNNACYEDGTGVTEEEVEYTIKQYKLK